MNFSDTVHNFQTEAPDGFLHAARIHQTHRTRLRADGPKRQPCRWREFPHCREPCRGISNTLDARRIPIDLHHVVVGGLMLNRQVRACSAGRYANAGDHCYQSIGKRLHENPSQVEPNTRSIRFWTIAIFRMALLRRLRIYLLSLSGARTRSR